jgi:hypothetical protein
MLKKIFKMAKKAAPVIGAGLGFLYGGPMLGSAIGGGLGSLVAGKSPKEALKFAAMAGLTGGALSKFGGMQAGQGLSGLFNKGAMQAGAGVGPRQFAAQTMQKGGVRGLGGQALGKQGMLSKGLGWMKANPLKSALGALLGAGAIGGEEEGTREPAKVYGTQDPFKDLGSASIDPNQLIPFSQYGPNFADGGIITLADGGDFPRRTGKIRGPGTETSDDIPAMLSDGEFVVNANTVRGLGSRLGGRGREDERERGSKYLYDMQNRYGTA